MPPAGSFCATCVSSKCTICGVSSCVAACRCANYQLLTKARILLKADISDAGEGWSDSRIAAALATSIATVERTRRQLVEEGFEAVLARKYNSNSARRRIFDGAAEAKLIALTLSPAPE